MSAGTSEEQERVRQEQERIALASQVPAHLRGYGSGIGRIEEFSVSKTELQLVTDCAAVYGDIERTNREMERKPLIAKKYKP